jgi:hypothetical protein
LAQTDTKGNSYGDLLADVVKDPGVKDIKTQTPAEPTPPAQTVAEKPPVKTDPPPAQKEEPPKTVDPKQDPVTKPVEVAETIKPDTSVAKAPVAVDEEKKVTAEPPTTEKPSEPKHSQVALLFKKGGAAGTDLIYTDRNGDKTDTIRIYIPPAAAETASEKEQQMEKDTNTGKKQQPPVKQILPPITEEKEKKTEKTDVPVEPEKKTEAPGQSEIITKTTEPEKPVVKNEEAKFLDIEIKNPHPAGDSLKTQPAAKADTVAAPPASGLVIVNSDCKKIAGEEDFVKLRVKMAGEKSNQDMMAVAAKAFKQRCFTVEQIKKLSVLMSDDEGKYRFFDQAYPFVYDTTQFYRLEQELTNEYYKNRFRAMIRR